MKSSRPSCRPSLIGLLVLTTLSLPAQAQSAAELAAELKRLQAELSALQARLQAVEAKPNRRA